MILIIMLYLCFAAGFTFGKAALTYIAPMLFVAVRMIIAGLLLVGYQYFFKKERLFIKKSHRMLFAGLCVFNIYGAYVLQYWAMQYVSSFKACLFYNLAPFFTGIFAYMAAHEIMTCRKWIGLIIGFIGMLPIFIESDIQENISGMMGFISYAELVLLVAVISGVIGWILMQKLVLEDAYSPFMINGISMLVGGIMALISSFVMEGWPRLIAQINAEVFFCSPLMAALFYIFLLILLCNIIAYNLYGVLLRSYSATFLSFAGFMTPLFTALLSTIFFGQVPSIWFFVSVFLVGCGLYIFYCEELRLQANS